MTKQGNITDLQKLVDKSVDMRMKPTLIMVASSEERIIERFNRLEDLVIRKRLFYRKIVLGCILFVALILLSG